MERKDIPTDFDWKFYLEYYEDLRNAGLKTENDAKTHYFNYGQFENRIYKSYELPIDFNHIHYLLLNTDLFIDHSKSEFLLKKHFFHSVQLEKRFYSKIKDCVINDVVFEDPIYLFYHIWAKNDWYEIFCEQIREIKSSGLWENLSKIFINICGDENDKIKVVNSLNSEKVKVNIVENDFEFPTLIQIKKVSQKYKFKGIYIHAKSTSYPVNHQNKWKYLFWTKLLNYQILKNWKVCYDKISSHDLVGTLFRSGNTSISDYWSNYSTVNNSEFRFTDHFSGNFYWFDSDYFSKLPDLTNEQKQNRFNAEWYCFQNSPKYFQIFNDFDFWAKELENKI